MRRVISIIIALVLVFGFALTGCKERESDAGKNIKRTLDRAQDAVDKVNKRQKDSIPKE